jgi:hypothetical protein
MKLSEQIGNGGEDATGDDVALDRANHSAQFRFLRWLGWLTASGTVNDVFNSEQLENHR